MQQLASIIFVLFVIYDGLLPYLCLSNPNEAPKWLIFISIMLFIFGVSIMMAADAQKHFSLKYNKGKLITNGLWKICRQPNYMGEIMLYFGLILLTRSFWAIIVVIVQWVLFATNMKNIEKRLSRYPEWKKYKSQTFSLTDYF